MLANKCPWSKSWHSSWSVNIFSSKQSAFDKRNLRAWMCLLKNVDSTVSIYNTLLFILNAKHWCHTTRKKVGRFKLILVHVYLWPDFDPYPNKLPKYIYTSPFNSTDGRKTSINLVAAISLLAKYLSLIPWISHVCLCQKKKKKLQNNSHESDLWSNTQIILLNFPNRYYHPGTRHWTA